MEAATEAGRRYTVEEYIALDDGAEGRFEFRDGEILAMSGAGFPHVQITGNVNRLLGNRLAGTPCQPLMLDMRVRAVRRRRYCYPDVSVVCGEPRFDPPDRQVTLVNPQVIFEVLLPGTELSDRGEKFTRYREMESLKEYLLVAQDRPRVEPFYRQADGGWGIGEVVDGLAGVVRLRSLAVELPLSDIYERVTFPPLPPEPDQPD